MNAEELQIFLTEKDRKIKIKTSCLKGIVTNNTLSLDMLDLIKTRIFRHDNPDVRRRAMLEMSVLIIEGYYNTS